MFDPDWPLDQLNCEMPSSEEKAWVNSADFPIEEVMFFILVSAALKPKDVQQSL